MKIKIPAIVSTAILSILFLSNCTSEVATPNICFQEDVLPLFVSNCTQAGCHNANDKVAHLDLSYYEGIMKSIKANHPFQSESWTQINSGSMPPSPYHKFTKYEKDIIKHWIKAGAPNSSKCSTCDTSFAYKTRIEPIFNKWCVGCHSATDAGGGYDFSSYDKSVLSITNNRLEGSIIHQSGYSAMPKNAGSLSDCDINAIKQWLAAGHPNN
ncbi:MAG: cytochrome c [bacterium]|nr:cytochrome c [bacterium]